MRRGLRALAVILTAVASLMAWDAAPSYAAGTGVAVLNGTFSPGLTTTSSPQALSITGTMVATDSGPFAGVCNVIGSGGITGSIVTGTGNMSVQCPSAPAGWPITYCAGSVTYVGSYWVWVPVCAGLNSNSVWVCVGEFNNINPATSVGWVCEVVYF